MQKAGAKAAKIIRVATIPPIMVLTLLLITWFFRRNIYRNVGQLLVSILFLMVIPILAYPLAAVIPKYKKQGRDGQRNLSFMGSAVGYAGVVVWGWCARVGTALMHIYLTYFFSVCILLLFNKVFKLRASGHACSIAGPLIMLVYLFGWAMFVPCALLFGAIIWASLYLKRHTPKELLWGSASAGIAFCISFLPLWLV